MNFSEKSFEVLAGFQTIKIAYREWGPQDSSKVVFCVHGRSRNMKDFDVFANAISDRCRVITIDLPGRGASDWLNNKSLYNYKLYELVCAHAIARSGAEKVIWFGTSMGGVVGMHLASKGAPFSKLILNDIGPYVSAKGWRQNNPSFEKYPQFKTEEEGIAYIRETRHTFGPFTEAGWQKFGRDSLRQLDDDNWTHHYDPALLKVPNKHLQDSDMWNIWNNITIPVLTVWGKESVLLTDSTVNRMSRTGPKSEILPVAGVGHCPGLTTPLEISTIAEFIDR